MKLWISAETQADVFESFRVASVNVEDCINATIQDQAYGLPLDAWDCIAILQDDTEFRELTTYSPKKRDMDFRLVIDYQKFKQGSDLARETLIYEMLMRSLSLLEQKGVSGKGMDRLKSDVWRVAIARGWE